MNRPAEMSSITRMRLERFFSSPNRMAKQSMKMMQVDLVMVYRLMVTNSNEKFDSPMSSELMMPTIDSLRT